MPLFDSVVRRDDSPAVHGEPTYRFLNRVKGRYWDDVRDLMDGWFDRFCPGAQSDLKGRLQSSDDRQFAAAFFELYLHETLVLSGYDVICHPDTPDTTRHPDFLVKWDHGATYVEARCITTSADDVVLENRRSRIYNAINDIDSPNFFVWVDVDEEAKTDPRTRPLRRKLEVWLGSLDPDVPAVNLDELPTMVWEEEGWVITFRAVAKTPEARGSDSGLRPLGVYGSSSVRQVDDVSPLKEALSEKGKAYGDLVHPYVIAVGTSSRSHEDFDVVEALFGTNTVEVTLGVDGSPSASVTRAPDGYWYGGTTWLHRQVTAVLIVRGLQPWRVAEVVPTLWHHPEPTMASSMIAPDWRQMRATENGLDELPPKLSPFAFFGLPEIWPTSNAFPDE